MQIEFLGLHFQRDGGIIFSSFIPIPTRTHKKVAEIQSAERRHEIVEIVQSPLVQILRQPVPSGILLRHPVHCRDQEGISVVRERIPGEEEGPGDAPHVLGELLVVELQLSDSVEPLCEAAHGQLRHEPHGRHLGVGRGRPPPLLDKGTDDGFEDRDEDARADAGEAGDAPAACETAGDGSEEAVVERDPEGDGEHGEDDVGCGGDLEVGGAEAAVRLERLEDDVLLLGSDVVEDGGEGDGDDAEDALRLLDLLDAAEVPRIGSRSFRVYLVLCSYDRSFVQESTNEEALVTINSPFKYFVTRSLNFFF